MSNEQKSNFARAAHFFCTFLCRCFARLQRETSRNFLPTRFMEKMSYVFLFTFFHCRSFSPRCPLSFLIFSPPLQNFMLFLQQLLVFSFTPFKIDQNKNQNHSTDKVQNVGNERRYIYKDPRQDLGRRNNLYTRYPRKCLTQIYRALYMESPCWSSSR